MRKIKRIPHDSLKSPVFDLDLLFPLPLIRRQSCTLTVNKRMEDGQFGKLWKGLFLSPDPGSIQHTTLLPEIRYFSYLKIILNLNLFPFMYHFNWFCKGLTSKML